MEGEEVSKWGQWRWVGLNACMFGSAMAMARVRGEAQEFEVAVCESVATTVCSLGVVFMVGVSTGLWWKKGGEPSREGEAVVVSEGAMRGRKSGTAVGSLRQYRLKEIVDMTERFKLELGRGGQGVVYFASLAEGRGQAAVKRLAAGDGQAEEAVEREFWAELRAIARLHHRNLVALLGYCVEEDDLFLVYEFMAKGSLSQRLHPRTPEDGEGLALHWPARLRCAVDVAQGLEYLHSHANPSLVHRDIKSANILFDDHMNAKIADFGLSKPLISGQEPTVSKRVRGTHGYV
jgi:aminoglycoside phosphotransferase (APT) family kinase protein